MSGKLTPINYKKIDDALIDNAYETAQKILLNNMEILDRVALTLLEKEKITSEEFEEFFK